MTQGRGRREDSVTGAGNEKAEVSQKQSKQKSAWGRVSQKGKGAQEGGEAGGAQWPCTLMAAGGAGTSGSWALVWEEQTQTAFTSKISSQQNIKRQTTHQANVSAPWITSQGRETEHI